MRLQAGTTLGGKFTLTRRIGFGGMGEVWGATNASTGADVALKILFGGREEDAARFKYEARLGSLLVHRNIARTFDLIEEKDGTLILVMELLRGVTLNRYLAEKGPLPAEEAVAIVSSVLSGLSHAHGNAVVHRDVKPANIFLAVDPDGLVTPKLLDFGIAKAAKANIHTMDGKVLGTPAYMSPEQIRADTLDGRSDLFAIGSILYEVLTGNPPFDTSVPSKTLAAVLEMPVDPDPRIAPMLWLEVKRALAKRPSERHTTADELAEGLLKSIGETPESIIAVLRQMKPATDLDVFETISTTQMGRDSVDGQSVTGPSMMRQRRRSIGQWAMIGTASVAVAIGALILVQRASNSVVENSSNAIASPSARESATPAGPAPSAAIEPISSAPAISSAALAAKDPPPPPSSSKSKTGKPTNKKKPQIATTPGF